MKKCSLLLAAAFAALPLAAATLTEVRHGEFKTLQVDSPFYTVTVAPESGGRIVRWLDKLKKVEIIRPFLPLKKDAVINFGGMLDDRGGMSFVPYQSVCSSEDGTVRIRMRGTRPDGLEINKQLIFPPDKPLVTVEYNFVNRSTRAASGLAFGNRNFIMPGGAPRASETWTYFVPTTHTIRRRAGFTFQSLDGTFRPPEMQSKLWCELSAPWIALLDKTAQQGMAVNFRDNGYFGCFAWKGGIDYPTWEWSFCDIPAGHQRKIVFDLIQIDDMTMLSSVTEQYLADMRCTFADGKLQISTQLKALEKLPSLRLATAITQVGGKFQIQPRSRSKRDSGSEARWDANLPEVSGDTFPALDAGKSAVMTHSYKVPQTGLFKITQTLYQGRKKFAEWRDVVTPDKTPFLPVLKMAHRGTGENIPLTGWKSDPADEIQVSPAAQTRGFALVEGKVQTPNTADTYYTGSRPVLKLTELAKLEINIASNEIASREVIVLPLKMLGSARAVLEGGAEFDARLQQETLIVRDSTAGGGGIRYHRILRDKLNFPLENRVSLWLRAGTRKGVRPGVYNCKIKVTSGNETAEIPVTIKVRDITLPFRPILSLESEGYPFTFPVGKDPEKIRYWFRNMTDHGIDFFQEFGGYDRVLVAGTKTTLARDMRKRPELYKSGKNLPALDFSPHDYLIDPAIRHGLVRFKACYYGRQDPDPVKLHYFAEGAKYIRSKGVQSNDLFFKLRDEQPPDQFPGMARIARQIKAFGYRPFSTFSLLFARPDDLAKLENQFEMFQGGFTTRRERAELINKGLLRPDAVVLTYTGVGTCIRSYEEQTHWGWNAAGLEHDMFHNHCYMRGGNAHLGGNIVYVDELRNLPLDSVGHEGLRDGMTGANLVALYREWRKLIGNFPENRELFARCDKRVQGIFEGKDALLPITQGLSHGIAVESVARMPRENYLKAHDIMLDVLEEIAPAAKKAAPRVASIRWNNLTLFDTSHTMQLSGPQELSAFFWKELAARTGFPEAQLQKGAAKLAVELKLDPAQSVSYRIDQTPQGIRITAKSDEAMKLAVGNFFNLVRMQGFWNVCAK